MSDDKFTVDASDLIVEDAPTSNELDPNKAALLTDTDPSEAQKEAGNYAKGKFNWNGLTISIENPQGSTRTGIRQDGTQWSREMATHYGYIKRTKSAADGDHVDVFIGPDLKSRRVFVVDQEKADGSFDEHKCLVGFNSREAAKQAYLANYPSGWRVGKISEMPVSVFRIWLFKGDTGKPIAR